MSFPRGRESTDTHIAEISVPCLKPARKSLAGISEKGGNRIHGQFPRNLFDTLFIALVLLIACLLPASVFAQGYDYFYGFGGMPDAVSFLRPKGEGIKVGPFNFTPSVSINGTYTDNARFSQGNDESDFIMSIDPSFTFALGQGLKLKDYVAFGYDGDLGAYLKVSDNSYTRHTLWAEANLLQNRPTYLKLREAITYTDDPYGTSNMSASEPQPVGSSTRRI